MFKIVQPVLAIVIALSILYFFVRPLYAELTQVQDDIAEHNEVLADASEFNGLLDALYNKQNGLGALERERLDLLVPDKIDEIRVLVDLEALAEREGLVFRDIDAEIEGGDGGQQRAARPQENVAVARNEFDGRLESRDVSFTVSGTYGQFRAFLRQIEQSLILMEVVNIEFVSTEETASWDYQVTVRIYGLRPMEEDA